MEARVINTTGTIVKHVDLETKLQQGRKYFHDGKFLAAKRAPGYLLYEAMVMKSKAKMDIYIPSREILKGSGDYKGVDTISYTLKEGVIETYKRIHAIYGTDILQIITEEAVKERYAANLWCEGTRVEPAYYLMILDHVNREVYRKVKVGHEIVVDMVRGDFESNRMLDAATRTKQACLRQISNCLKLMYIEEQRKAIKESVMAISGSAFRVIEEFEGKHKGGSSVAGFIKTTKDLLLHHSRLELSPTPKDRFLYTLDFNPKLKDTFDLPDGYQPVDPISENDLNQEMIAMLGDKTLLATKVLGVVNRKGDTKAGVPLLKHLPKAVVYSDEINGDVMVKERLETTAIHLKETVQLSTLQVLEYLDAGWKLDDYRHIVCPYNDRIMLKPCNLRNFFNTPTGERMIQDKEVRIIKPYAPIPKFSHFSPAPKLKFKENEILEMIENQPHLESLLRDDIRNSMQNTKVDAIDAKIKEEVRPVIEHLIRDQREPFIRSFIKKTHSGTNPLFPTLPQLHHKLLKHIRLTFAGCQEAKVFKDRLKKHKNIEDLLSIPQIIVIIEKAVENEVRDEENLYRYYLANVVISAELLIEQGVNSQFVDDMTKIALRDIKKCIQELRMLAGIHPVNYQKMNLTYLNMTRYKLKSTLDHTEDFDDAMSMQSAASASNNTAAANLLKQAEAKVPSIKTLLELFKNGTYDLFLSTVNACKASSELRENFRNFTKELAHMVVEAGAERSRVILEERPISGLSLCRLTFYPVFIYLLGVTGQTFFLRAKSYSSLNTAIADETRALGAECVEGFISVFKFCSDFFFKKSMLLGGVTMSSAFMDKTYGMFKENFHDLDTLKSGTGVGTALDEFIFFISLFFSGNGRVASFFTADFKVSGGRYTTYKNDANLFVRCDSTGLRVIFRRYGTAVNSDLIRLFGGSVTNPVEFIELFQDKKKATQPLPSIEWFETKKRVNMVTAAFDPFLNDDKDSDPFHDYFRQLAVVCKDQFKMRVKEVLNSIKTDLNTDPTSMR